MNFKEEELAKLRMFRELASDIYPYVMRYNAFNFRIRIPDGGGQLIPEEPFHRIISFVRQAYLPKEDTHFYRMLKIVGKRRPDLRPRLRKVRDQWKGSKHDSMFFRTAGETYRTEEVFQHHLNAKYAHRKVEAGRHLRNLRSFGDFPQMPLQIYVLNLARCVLVLDCLIADALGETRLPNLDLGDIDE